MFPTKKALRAIAVAAVVASTTASVGFAFGLIRGRPLMYGEAEVLYEASRIARHLPLYTDPLSAGVGAGVGAASDDPPSRVFVTYPPLWSWLLSFLGASTAALADFARIIDSLAWFALLAWIARPPKTAPRFVPIFVAAYVAGIYVLVLWSSSGRPDTPAVVLAAIALVRTIRAKRLGPLEAALFALAFWTKPNVAGMALGAFFVQMIIERKAFVRALTWAATVSLLVCAVLYLASGGQFLAHLDASLGQPLRLASWTEQLRSRTAFALPLAAMLVLAWRVRRDPQGRYAAAGFVGALVVALVSLSKLGSASNYWLETGVAAVILSTCANEEKTVGVGVDLLVAFAAVWQAVATIGSVREDFAAEPRRVAFLRSVTTRCLASPTDVVLADDPGIELAVDHRVVAPAFQMDALVRAGRFPADAWARDMTGPHVRCLVTHGPLEASGAEDSLHERYPPELRRALLAHFDQVEQNEGLVLYRAR